MSHLELPAELLDEFVHPDIHSLFQHYSELYFDGELGHCSVEWSSGRMTSCAGTCQFKSGGGCIIRLSEPILKLRPPEDLKNTLIHEMIHAYIFLKRIPGAGNDGHGPPFKDRMKKINDSTVPDFHRPAEGYRITVYHTMIDEVRHYQQHWWECERCKDTIKRATNRKPQEADCFTRHGSACSHPKCRYHTHLRTCGGAYIKIKEPEPKRKEPKSSKSRQKAAASADKPPKGQSTLSAAFAQGWSRGPGVSGEDQEGPRIFDLLDDAIDQTMPWLTGTSHANTKTESPPHSAPGAASRALETDLVNLLSPLAPCNNVMVTARGGGVSTGEPTPTESADAAAGTVPAMHGSNKHDRGGGSVVLVDLTDDVDDNKGHTSPKREDAAAVATGAVAQPCGQIFLLSDSDDDNGAEHRGGGAGTSQRVKRTRTERDAGVRSQLQLPAVGDSAKQLPNTRKDGAGESGEQVHRDLRSEPVIDPSAGGTGPDLETCGAVGVAGEGGGESQEDLARERARRRMLCAAAAAARLARGNSEPPDQQTDDPKSA